jgi:predicted Zn finger-like uncharacterized protein
MKTQCPHCKAKFKARDESVGKKVKCPKCKQFFIINPIENISSGNIHPETTEPAPKEMPLEDKESKDVSDESHEKSHKGPHFLLYLYLVVGILLICDGIFGIVKFEVKDKKELIHTIKGFRSPAIDLVDSSGRRIHHYEINTPDGVFIEPGLSRMRAGAIPPVVAGLLLLICLFRKGFRFSGWKFISAFLGAILIGAACGCPFAPPATPPKYFVTIIGHGILQLTRVISFLLDLSIIRLGVPLNVSLWLSVFTVTLILLALGIYWFKAQIND